MTEKRHIHKHLCLLGLKQQFHACPLIIKINFMYSNGNRWRRNHSTSIRIMRITPVTFHSKLHFSLSFELVCFTFVFLCITMNILRIRSITYRGQCKKWYAKQCTKWCYYFSLPCFRHHITIADCCCMFVDDREIKIRGNERKFLKIL